MTPIANVIDERLSTLTISSKEFSELLIRLLDYGVLNRDESQIEAALYDRYLQCADLVEDYLAVIHVKLLHDRTFRFVRVFPPSAEVPGLADNDHQDDGPFQHGLRSKPSPQAIAVILVLRVEYEKALREGKVDEQGGVLIPLEQLSIAMNNLLKQGLPATQLERNAIFKQLRQLRLIKLNSDTPLNTSDDQDNWLRIEPSITSFVTQSMLDQLYPPKAETISTENDGLSNKPDHDVTPETETETANETNTTATSSE